MKLGAHISTAGGLHKVFLRAKELGCETIQIFTKSCVRWEMPALTHAELQAFSEERRLAGIEPVFAHCGYLVNLGSSESRIFLRSVQGLEEEMERARVLRLPFLVLHPGSSRERSETQGLKRIARALREVLSGFPRGPLLLLETTAGQGMSLGYTFEQLAFIIEESGWDSRMGVCFDTSHVFASGYDISNDSSLEGVLRAFDRIIGLQRIKAFHLNDSAKPLGSRIDRHTHIGKGFLGQELFRLLLRGIVFRDVPAVIETPKRSATGRIMDPINLSILRKLRGSRHRSSREKHRKGCQES